ncbi:MAG TPA: TetR/AcrR family transcriptional regulator [Actinocrinis sp.]|nr:TetR/AcrR family transcriptional regulator [Actinocrinis sp.]
MPKLWNETVAAHREAVREAILDAAWQLVAELGLSAVTMSHIAEKAGIGRATLYKYFPDVDAILVAWHERQITAHLQQLAAIRDQNTEPAERLGAVLTGYAFLSRHRGAHPGDLATFLHRGTHVEPAQQQLRSLVTQLLAEAAAAGAIRADTDPSQLASYALHALAAAADLPDESAVHRLVELVVAGLRPGE